MQKFEDGIRERRKQLKELKNIKKKSKNKVEKKEKSKRDVSVNERLNLARELVAKNYSTNQISKILQISERSVTRIKKKLREEKRRLKAEGKIPRDPDSSDEESFKFLKAKEKLEKAKELFQKHLKISEISKILRISERSVRRWKDRLNRIENDPNAEREYEEPRPKSLKRRSARAATENSASAKPLTDIEEDEHQENYNEDGEEGDTTEKMSKRRRFDIDKNTLQYARQLVANGMKIKEMVGLLDLPFYTVRRLRTKILNNVPDEEIITITDPEEFYVKKEKEKVETNESENEVDFSADPLNVNDDFKEVVERPPPMALQYGYERKSKTVLSVREMILVKLLRESNVRTMDIARIMNISERSVTRLLTRSKQIGDLKITTELIEEAERLKAQKDIPVVLEEMEPGKPNPICIAKPETAKMALAKNLLAMNVKLKDISKMLEVSLRTLTRWKANFEKQGELEMANGDDGSDDEVEVHPVSNLVSTVISSDSSSSSSSSSSDDSSSDDSDSDSDDSSGNSDDDN